MARWRYEETGLKVLQMKKKIQKLREKMKGEEETVK
jgi:hypothetical protein